MDDSPRGRLKINIDGAFGSDHEKGDIGVVVRDNEGKCIAALQRSITLISTALHVEADGCRDSLLLAIQQG